MKSIVLQDWTTVRGSGTTPVIQTSDLWLDLAAYGDVIFWLDVREVTNPGAGSVTLTYETAPLKDEILFQPMLTVSNVSVGAPTISKVLLASNPAVPLARFVRWKLVGSTAGTWDVTFRVQAVLSSGVAGAWTPNALSGLVLWLRADMGVTLSSGNVSSWADQSGLGDSGRNAVQATGANQPPFVSSDPSYNGQPTIGNFASGQYLQTGNWSASYATPFTLIVAGNVLNNTGNRYLTASAMTNRLDMFNQGGWASVIGGPDASSVILADTSHDLVAKSIFCVEWNGASTKLFVNSKTASLTGDAGTPPLGAYPQIFGNYRGGAAGYETGGKIAEVIAYSRALASTERDSVLEYLARRYAVALT